MSSKPCRIFAASAVTLLCFFLFETRALFAQEPNDRDTEGRTGLQYSNERLPQNVFVLGMYTLGTYDDNMLNNNRNRVRDSLLDGGGLLGFHVLRPKGKMLLDYRPNFEVYQHRQFSGRDQFNQAVEFTGDYKLTPHFLLNASDTFSYQKGILQPRSNGGAAFAPVAPGGLNGSVLVPLVRTLTNQARLGAKFLSSRRSTFDVFGTYSQRNFKNGQTAVGNLLNTQGYGGGGSYQYRTSQTTTLGLRYVYQDMRFGQTSRALIHSGYLTLGHNFDESIASLELFVGPQLASTRETSVSSPTTPPPPPTTTSADHRDVGGGATLTVRSAKTVFRILLLRELSDGGGLVTLARNSSEGLEIRRRLWRGLDLVLSGANGQSTSFSDVFGRGTIHSQNAGFAFEYPLGAGLVLHLGYTYLRQRTTGNIPFTFDVDRNRAGLGFFYQPGPFPLGQ